MDGWDVGDPGRADLAGSLLTVNGCCFVTQQLQLGLLVPKEICTTIMRMKK